ncbi:hypothetical protein FQ775_03100 [Nitratireductor mangrovi]|uniref:DUF5681 domain-containing protein n=1 Tax=Nitratireductor mangrovi TaxID=2599600 RepID=A0A5B8KV53_9HYPH|nr:DUF5681 domain-containing protein [Nitratireductor mangrovi]QDY99441.2 hypothetical protein FQ775_03100 [Nitratireductor mangrovi]
MSDDGEKSSQEPKPIADKAVARAKEQIIGGVGYRNPPKATRFQRGQSGNPGGRPRAPKAEGLTLEDQPLLQAVHDQAAKPIRMREGDTVLEVPTREAVTRSVMVAALKGNARSQGLALDLIRSADIQRARDRSKRQAFAHEFKRVQTRRFERAVEAGEETRRILPHPDDIVIDDDYGYHFAGPVDEAELCKVEQIVRYRDALIMQDVLDERLAARQASQTEQPDRSEQSGALLFASVLDSTLPSRFRLDDTTIILRQLRYEAVNLRQLLKDTYRAWKAAGASAKRGARFADLQSAHKLLTNVFDFVQAVREGRIDVDAIARGEFDETPRPFIRGNGSVA